MGHFTQAFLVQLRRFPRQPVHTMVRKPLRSSVGPSFIFTDFCCHLRRFEKHGNAKLKDPWSLRQMTTCQRFDIVNQTSTWIFIKPMENFQNSFQVLLSGDQRNNPMAPHLLALTMASENWRWYVDFLRRRLGEFVSSKVFSVNTLMSRRSRRQHLLLLMLPISTTISALWTASTSVR